MATSSHNKNTANASEGFFCCGSSIQLYRHLCDMYDKWVEKTGFNLTVQEVYPECHHADTIIIIVQLIDLITQLIWVVIEMNSTNLKCPSSLSLTWLICFSLFVVKKKITICVILPFMAKDRLCIHVKQIKWWRKLRKTWDNGIVWECRLTFKVLIADQVKSEWFSRIFPLYSYLTNHLVGGRAV